MNQVEFAIELAETTDLIKLNDFAGMATIHTIVAGLENEEIKEIFLDAILKASKVNYD